MPKSVPISSHNHQPAKITALSVHHSNHQNTRAHPPLPFTISNAHYTCNQNSTTKPIHHFITQSSREESKRKIRKEKKNRKEKEKKPVPLPPSLLLARIAAVKSNLCCHHLDAAAPHQPVLPPP
jgi:hypothetical protein